MLHDGTEEEPQPTKWPGLEPSPEHDDPLTQDDLEYDERSPQIMTAAAAAAEAPVEYGGSHHASRTEELRGEEGSLFPSALSRSLGARSGKPLTGSGEAIEFVYGKVIELDEKLRDRDATIAILRAELASVKADAAAAAAAAAAATASPTMTRRKETQQTQQKEKDEHLSEWDRTARAMREHTLSLMALERDPPPGMNLPKELYAHVVELERQLVEAAGVVQSRSEELARTQRLVKSMEARHAKECATYQASLEAARGDSSPAAAQSRIAEAERQLAEVLGENRALVEAQRARTKAIEEMTAELARRTTTEQVAQQLRAEVADKLRTIAALTEENARLIRLVTRKDEELSKALGAASVAGVPFESWMAERGALKAEVKAAKEANAGLERRLKRMQEHVDKVDGRINMLTRSSASLQGAGDDGDECTRSSVVEAMGETVPARLYAVVEQNARRLQGELARKERELIEKSAAITALEQRIRKTLESAQRRRT